jgi:hypothetical protein
MHGNTTRQSNREIELLIVLFQRSRNYMKYLYTVAKSKTITVDLFLLTEVITRLTAIVEGFKHTPISPKRTRPTTMIQLPLREAGRARMSMHRMRCGSVAKGVRRWWGDERRETTAGVECKLWIVDDTRGVGDRIAFAYRLISWISAGGEEEDVEWLVIDWIRYRRLGWLVYSLASYELVELRCC